MPADVRPSDRSLSEGRKEFGKLRRKPDDRIENGMSDHARPHPKKAARLITQRIHGFTTASQPDRVPWLATEAKNATAATDATWTTSIAITNSTDRPMPGNNGSVLGGRRSMGSRKRGRAPVVRPAQNPGGGGLGRRTAGLTEISVHYSCSAWPPALLPSA